MSIRNPLDKVHQFWYIGLTLHPLLARERDEVRGLGLNYGIRFPDYI